jgi:aminotransferase
VAPAALIQAMLPFHHAMTICAPVTAQIGATAALSTTAAGSRRSSPSTTGGGGLADGARRHGPALRPPSRAYYVFFDVRPTGLDAKTFVRRAGEEAAVTLGTGGGGAAEGWIRGSLMQRSPQLEEGLDRLAGFVRGL